MAYTEIKPNAEQDKIIKGQAHEAIESGYDKALAHYKWQKEQFLQMIKREQDKTGEEFMKLLEEQLSKTSQDEALEELFSGFDTGFAKIVQLLANSITAQFQGQDELKAAQQDLQNLLKIQRENSEKEFVEYNTAKKRLNDFLEHKLMLSQEQLLEAFNSGVDNKFGSISDESALNQIRGIARRFLYDWALGNEKTSLTSYNRNILKGYYKEVINTAALQAVIKKSNEDMSAIQVGGDITNEKGNLIIYDILVGSTQKMTDGKELQSFIKVLDSYEKGRESTGSERTFIGTGAQSKSWSLPIEWKENRDIPTKALYFLEVANRSDLLPKDEEELYYWHAGVRQAMNNIIDIIGPGQGLFFTGNKPYFTADLLAQFKSKQYVLAFGMGKEKNDEDLTFKWKLLKTVYFRLHDDAKTIASYEK